MKNGLLKTAAMIFSAVMAISAVPAVQAQAASKSVFVAPSGRDSTSDYIAISEFAEKGGYRIRLRGTYYLNGMLRLASNTYLDAKGATIICNKSGSKMVTQAEPDKSKGAGSQGKYNAVHDITVDGGTWVGTKKFSPDAMVKDGQKTGPNVFNFIHAKNITIKDATIYNVPNAHLIEFCGVKNGRIENCRLGCYKDANGKLIKGYTSGDKKRAAIQLDACDSAANNPLAWPYDHTVCNNVTIKNNYVWFYTGVQAAEKSKNKTTNVKVTGNTFKCKNKFGWLGNTKKFSDKKNKTVKYTESPTKSSVRAHAIRGLSTDLDYSAPRVSNAGTDTDFKTKGISLASVFSQVGDGADVKLNITHRSDEAVNETGYAYLYNHSNGTYQCIHDAWFGGRYYNKANVFVKGVSISDDFGRAHDIYIKDPTIVFPSGSYKYKNHLVSKDSVVYSASDNTLYGYVRYRYDAKNKEWFAANVYSSITGGNKNSKALISALTITASQAKRMGVDENTDTNPTDALDFTE